MTTRRILKEGLLICLIGLALALISNALRPDGLPLLSPRPDASTPEAVAASVPAILLDSAIRHFENGTAVFVDARSLEAYRAGHIAGARSLPDDAFDAYLGPFFEAVDPTWKIITYCDGAACDQSRTLAEKLRDVGYGDVAYLPDGWRLWLEESMPVAVGDLPEAGG